MDTAASSPSPPPAVPLAGDLVAALTQRLGADRAARFIAAKLGVDCGCAARQQRRTPSTSSSGAGCGWSPGFSRSLGPKTG
jgi:hypothetical protein